jgi:aminopeptidase
MDFETLEVLKMYDFEEKLAKLTVKYALDVQPGDLVSIEGSEVANPLKLAMYVECVKAGAHVMVSAGLKETGEAFYKYANDEQLMFIDPVMKTILGQYQKRIQISSDYNRKKMALVPPEKMNMYVKNPEFPELMRHTKKGLLRRN